MSKDLKEIPVQFGVVTGKFECSYNKLTTLNGCPHEIGGYFSCINNNLKTLAMGPQKVGEDYMCLVNSLDTLEGIASSIKGTIYLGDCKEVNWNTLKSIEHVSTLSMWCEKLQVQVEDTTILIDQDHLPSEWKFKVIEIKNWQNFINSKFLETKLSHDLPIKETKTKFKI